MSSRNLATRRTFLQSAAATGIAAGPWGRLVRAPSPNGKVQHAAIGTGGMGWADLNRIASHPEAEIVALCDVDTRRMKRAAEKFPHARRYQDWRRLLAEEGDKVDSINVSVPDHMHAPITINALAMGKHVYCQKPLAHDVHEARQMAAAAKRAGLVTQMGNQFSSSRGDRTAEHLLRTGTIGRVKAVFFWSNKDPWKYRPKGPRPEKTDPIPKELNWDWWCGTAPVRPYVHDTYHPTWWRGWQDFGCGWLGDMGCHIMDMPYRALRLGAPLSVRAEVEPEWREDEARRAETFPTWQIVRYTFPGTDLTVGRTIDVTWSDGGKFPPAPLQELLEGRKWPKEGAFVAGEDGHLLMPHTGKPRLFPQEKMKGVERPELEEWNHYHQFVDAILGKNGGKTRSSFDYAGPLAEAVLLGTIALRCPGETLRWDGPTMKVTNLDAGNGWVRRSYRQGWKVKGV